MLLLFCLSYFILFLAFYRVNKSYLFIFISSTSLHIIFSILPLNKRTSEWVQLQKPSLVILFVCPSKPDSVVSVHLDNQWFYIYQFLFSVATFNIFLVSGFSFLIPNVQSSVVLLDSLEMVNSFSFFNENIHISLLFLNGALAGYHIWHLQLFFLSILQLAFHWLSASIVGL